MIVVEGPDGSGKTALIKQLREEFNLPVAPRVVSKDTEAMIDLRTWVDNNLDEGFQNTIFDRYRLISETIYGPVLRHGAQSGFDEMSWLAPRLERFYRLRPIIIYCLPPLKEVQKNVFADDENAVVRMHISRIYSAYVARAAFDYALAPGTVKVWDYTKSLTINEKPVFFPLIREELEGRLANERQTA